MALKQQHKTDKMATNDMKMGWICDNDKENQKYKSKTTAFEIQTRGIHPPPPLPQEGLFIIIIIIIII